MNKNFFINLLPSILKTNEKWISFFSVLESFFREVLNKNVNDKFLNKYNYEYEDEDNLRDLISKNGSIIPAYDGYTSTNEFLKRRVYSLRYEIVYRNSKIAYKYILRSYYLDGTIISLRKTLKGLLGLYLSSTEMNSKGLVADREKDLIQYYISGEPFPNPPPKTGESKIFADTYMDSFNLFPLTSDFQELRDFTNFLMIDYRFKYIENENDFVSSGTIRSLYELVEHYKKMKQLIRYQPQLEFNFISNNPFEKIYKDYTHTIQSSMFTIHFNGTLLNAYKIQIGTGKHINLSDAINGVQIKIYESIILDSFIMLEEKDNLLSFENIKNGNSTLLDMNDEKILRFSEIALLDSSDNVICYSYFPNVIFYFKMITSLRFVFNLI